MFREGLFVKIFKVRVVELDSITWHHNLRSITCDDEFRQ